MHTSRAHTYTPIPAHTQIRREQSICTHCDLRVSHSPLLLLEPRPEKAPDSNLNSPKQALLSGSGACLVLECEQVELGADEEKRILLVVVQRRVTSVGREEAERLWRARQHAPERAEVNEPATRLDGAEHAGDLLDLAEAGAFGPVGRLLVGDVVREKEEVVEGDPDHEVEDDTLADPPERHKVELFRAGRRSESRNGLRVPGHSRGALACVLAS